MIGLLQRVSRASVEVAGQCIATIGPGLLVLVGVEQDDTAVQVRRLLERILAYRVFSDAEGRMNRSLRETGGGLLLVPQFTLAADTRKGNRPGFSPAAPPEQGRELFESLCGLARAAHPEVGCGAFGADMQVELVNDGPVTFWLQTGSAIEPA
ncbi:MAG TPA: D-aminoacyl-tRNA deacylase [Gammaproteobacteria bacterium]|nr:D-aminoacyl-tRNA deacylase [Gammaproteobacteria bacterium]